MTQDQPQVTLFYRDAEGAWDVARFAALEQTITLPCPEATLTLTDIYEGVDFTQPAESDA